MPSIVLLSYGESTYDTVALNTATALKHNLRLCTLAYDFQVLLVHIRNINAVVIVDVYGDADDLVTRLRGHQCGVPIVIIRGKNSRSRRDFDITRQVHFVEGNGLTTKKLLGVVREAMSHM